MTTLRKLAVRVSVVAVCLAIVANVGSAQKSDKPSDAEHTRQVLVANARALDARGRPDMAIQLWHQILLSDPNNAEALAGLARDYKLSGNIRESDQTLEKLRTINPNDPALSQIEALPTGHDQNNQLHHAGELARQGKNDEAMNIYRQLYGDHPPDGDIALGVLSDSLWRYRRQGASHRWTPRPCAAQSWRPALCH